MLLYLLDEPVPYVVTYDDDTTEEIVPLWQRRFHEEMERLPKVSENQALYQVEEEDVTMAVTSINQEILVRNPAEAQRRLLALVGELAQRMNYLDARVGDLEEWLGEMADDVLDRGWVA